MSKHLVRALAVPQSEDGPMRKGKRACLLTQAKCDTLTCVIVGSRAWPLQGSKTGPEFTLLARPIAGSAAQVASVRRYYGHMRGDKWAPCFCDYTNHIDDEDEDDEEDDEDDEDDDEALERKRKSKKKRKAGPDPNAACVWPLVFLGFLSKYSTLTLRTDYEWTSLFHSMTRNAYVEWHATVVNLWGTTATEPLRPEDRTLLRALHAAKLRRGTLSPAVLRLVSAPHMPDRKRLDALLPIIEHLRAKPSLSDRARLWYHWHMHKYGPWSLWDFAVTGDLTESLTFVRMLATVAGNTFRDICTFCDHAVWERIHPGVGGVLSPEAPERVRLFLVRCNLLTQTPPPLPVPLLLLFRDGLGGHDEMDLHQAATEHAHSVTLVDTPWIDEDATAAALKPYLQLPHGRVATVMPHACVEPFFLKLANENGFPRNEIALLKPLNLYLLSTTPVVLVVGAHIPSALVAQLVVTRVRNRLRTILVGDPYLGRPRAHTMWSTYTSMRAPALFDVAPPVQISSVQRGLVKTDYNWDPYVEEHPFVGEMPFFAPRVCVRARHDAWMNYVLAVLRPERVTFVVCSLDRTRDSRTAAGTARGGWGAGCAR